MKRVLHRWFCLLMACIVLVASTGFGLVEHSCMVRGKKLYLAAQKDSGCASCHRIHRAAASAATQDTVKRTDCCQNKAEFRNISVTASLSQLVAKLLKSVSDLALEGLSVAVRWLVGLLLPQNESVALSLESPPTSLAGRSLLAFVQQFLL